jgi:hypothetical protein
MDKVEEYRDEAAAALELSAFEEDRAGKIALLIIAKGWLDLARVFSSQSPQEVPGVEKREARSPSLF